MKTYRVETWEYQINNKVHFVNAESRQDAINCVKTIGLETDTAVVIDSEPDNIIGVDKVKVISARMNKNDLTEF